MSTSRRGLLVGTGMLAAGAAASARAAVDPAAAGGDAAWLQGVLERFAGFGIKASGGPGDTASGAWVEGDLTALGYRCERQAFETPDADVRTATLKVGERTASVYPQAIVKTTGPGGLSGPLKLAATPGSLEGAIALIVLPFKRWGFIGDPDVARPLTDAFARGAAAAVLVTTGPTREVIALNVHPTQPGHAKPVATLAPRDAEPFVAAAAAGQAATLTVDAVVGRRAAYNVIARLDRGAKKTLIVTTPRSGWFTCAAERGAGLAVWLSLAHWLAAAKPRVNLEFVATSGHEYIYYGGEQYLEHHAPKPADTHLWVHIGASAAARDWHEFGQTLRPLPTPDSSRVLTATPQVIEATRRAFKGISGLEAVYPADRANAGGELVNVIEAGYTPAIGLYGGHRFFHTPGDDMRCVSGELVAPVAKAFRAAVAASLPA
ncbi:MAG: M28 family peptidase [Phenylobacterium sp.]|uniref:M28 family peptidase n=1 Tax=Phenylobacterium sp. TaxID=1871053 RepID=UPI001A41D1B4|nr:M28 family peptidase [Phenylobacterium sp.]MBL8556505.1 M28 family peptidase [Phenylobacterium sp.]